MTCDANMGSGPSIPPVNAPRCEKLSVRSTVVRDMEMQVDLDPDAGEAVALAQEIARLEEARAERDELLLELEETRVSIMWLEAELRGLRKLGELGELGELGLSGGWRSKRPGARRAGGLIRAVWAAAGAVALVATLWVLR